MINPHELPVPSEEQPILQIQALAADIAYGVLKKMWPADLPTSFNSQNGLGLFLAQKWNNNYPSFDALYSLNYFTREFRYQEQHYTPTEKAYALLETIPPKTKVFISYSRSNSSALALALHYRLTQLGVNSFLDMNIDLGEEWHAELESRIVNADYFIPILSPESLKSPFIREEMAWAAKAKRSCIPIWHAGFSPKLHVETQKDLDEQTKIYIKAKNAYEITGKENALAFHTAILSVLNQLGYSGL